MSGATEFPLPAPLAQVLAHTPALRRAYLVGGCVRDWLRGEPTTDHDLEVFGLSYPELARALAPWGKADLVGRSFGVVKLKTPDGSVFDFSLPRRDSKVSPGHKGFEVQLEPDLPLEAAAARRDFTINALMYDPREKRLLDFFGGATDLGQRILRHTSAAFAEDPLRVLRGLQFAARFELEAAPETVALAREIRPACAELPRERVREEWFKWAAQSRTPSLGLRWLDATGWIEQFPELAALRGLPQDPAWHPEGDVFVHTGHCCDAMARLPAWTNARYETRVVLMLAALTHDFGKAATTTVVSRPGGPKIVSPGHDLLGAPLARSFLERIGAPHEIQERVKPLVLNHMAHFETVTDRGIRRLSQRLEPENIDSLLALMTADAFGRPPRPAVVPASVAAIAQKAAELNVRTQAPAPLLLGRHLLGAGLHPGPQFGKILESAYSAQLEGQFSNLPGALSWILTQDFGLSADQQERIGVQAEARTEGAPIPP